MRCKSTILTIVLFVFCVTSAYAGCVCTRGNCTNGWGAGACDDGNMYVGSWVGGVMQGKGTMVFYQDAGVYMGQYQNGRWNGQGMVIHGNGATYTGEFRNNMMHGQGTLKYPDGRMTTGWFENNIQVK